MYNVFRMCLQYYPSLFILLYLYAKIIGRIKRHNIETKVNEAVFAWAEKIGWFTIHRPKK